MLASLEEPPLRGEQWVYEPKYDGIRAIIEVVPGDAPGGVRIHSRLGADKTAQFPEVVRALDRFRRGLKAPVVLDGEIVALDERGEPAGFQRLQGRIHLSSAGEVEFHARRDPVAFVAFDILRDGGTDLRALPLSARRAQLERVFGNAGSGVFRLSEFVPGDATALHRRAETAGWEGLIAKRLDSPYRSGLRTRDWRKIKLQKRQEFVVGGFTEPRNSRAFFGALLLGFWKDGALEYAGHTGTGFSGAELARVAALLRPLETSRCPFRARPDTNERPHWVEPRLVAEVRFTEWTADGRLRHPAYLGLRDDVRASAVVKESAAGSREKLDPARARLLARLEELEAGGGAGTLEVAGGGRLQVTNLDKVFWKSLGITKGELMRYYVRVAPWILPVVADRPLIMKRFPNGVHAKAFYQQRAPGNVPAGVRVETLPSDRVVPRRLVGGSLLTLLYMTHYAVVSQDPWFSRVQSPDEADHAVLDLDPMPGVPFAHVLDVARWLHDELERLGTPSVPKTSGAEGLHIYVPLPRGTSYEASRLFCQIVATLVADAHPKIATVTRGVTARGRRVYIDYLQNSRGKTLACAYSARATPWAGVSTPLTWREVHAGVEREAFTLATTPARLRAVGDLWAPVRSGKTADLHAALAALGARSPGSARE
ncbi:MAG TPA: DNA ligase D [Methylomirabilota bacterium]|jgi:bifunctional non-homologous end joining protein LigD